MSFSVPTRQTAHLTLEERDELERAVDGPITEQMVKDKIAQRGASRAYTPTLEDLHVQLRWADGQARFYAGRGGDFARGQEQMYRRVAADIQRSIAAHMMQIATEQLAAE